MADKDQKKQDTKPQAKPEPQDEQAQPGVYIVNGKRVDANGKPVKG